MTISEIYRALKNPPNLQQHMLRVAKVSLFILNHWQGKPIHKELLIKAALLHDVGNIVKFNIKKYPHFLGEEQNRAQYWIAVQEEMIKKYGTDDHLTTKSMLNELGVADKIVNTIYSMSYWNAPAIKDSDDWVLKILLYSDLRVSPNGIISIRERLDDLYSRLEKYKNRIDLSNAGTEIEKQIQQNLNANIIDINDETTKTDENKLLKIQVETK